MKGIDQSKLKTLTDQQREYFSMMYPKYGVLFLTAQPGVAKSAIMKTIADKLGFHYIDLRLSMVDETDVGLYPYLRDVDSNTKVMSYAVPEWALKANQQPTIIHFEELNRAPLAVRNAALQLLLERRIGPNFQFNNNVYMCSSGNLGEKDGTTVEEFDRALNNRLIHKEHILTLPDWISDFAKENVHYSIVSFLKSHENYFIQSLEQKESNENHSAYPTPRSWTMLSEYITANYGKKSKIDDFSTDIRVVAPCYIGEATAQRFYRYLDDQMKFTIDDIINRYDEVKHMFDIYDRDKKSEMLNILKEKDVTILNDEQMENVKKFILSCSDDEVVSFLLSVLDSDYKYTENINSDENNLVVRFLDDKRLLKYYDSIYANVPKEEEKEK